MESPSTSYMLSEEQLHAKHGRRESQCAGIPKVLVYSLQSPFRKSMQPLTAIGLPLSSSRSSSPGPKSASSSRLLGYKRFDKAEKLHRRNRNKTWSAHHPLQQQLQRIFLRTAAQRYLLPVSMLMAHTPIKVSVWLYGTPSMKTDKGSTDSSGLACTTPC